MTKRVLMFLAGVAALPGVALAQAQQCIVPQSFPKTRALMPPPGETVIAPPTGYILALSWSPQFCKVNGEKEKYDSQCRGGQKFGFIVHGLWADGTGRNDPRWCKRVPAVPPEVLKGAFCATPSESLMQHEWAKHGSCVEPDSARYFATSTRLFNSLKFPDMDALSRETQTVGGFVQRFTALNPGIEPDMVRVYTTPLGWIEELRICLDRNYRPRDCPIDINGSSDSTRFKIWRTN